MSEKRPTLKTHGNSIRFLLALFYHNQKTYRIQKHIDLRTRNLMFRCISEDTGTRSEPDFWKEPLQPL